MPLWLRLIMCFYSWISGLVIGALISPQSGWWALLLSLVLPLCFLLPDLLVSCFRSRVVSRRSLS